jgi:septal ring factor EnvC (AmiA/AmiB activator)
MWPDETIERGRPPDFVDVYFKNDWDERPRWKEDSETLRREELKRRNDLERRMRQMQRIRRRMAQQQRAVARAEAAVADARAKRTGDTADINDATISRLGGGAALGTVIGTAITPGIGTVAGAVLGGIVGAFGPRVLSRKHSGTRNNNKAATRVR